jgi:hypothetical protein
MVSNDCKSAAKFGQELASHQEEGHHGNIERTEGSCEDPNDSSSSMYMRRALQILIDQNIYIPGEAQLAEIVVLALRAQELFFAASVHHPDTSRLRNFFDNFVRRAVEPDVVALAPTSASVVHISSGTDRRLGA